MRKLVHDSCKDGSVVRWMVSCNLDLECSSKQYSLQYVLYLMYLLVQSCSLISKYSVSSWQLVGYSVVSV